MNLMTEPIGLKTRGAPVDGEFDDYGNQVYGSDIVSVRYGWYEPRSSGEDTSAKDQQVYGYWVVLPLDAPIAGADAVVLFGTVGDDGQMVGGEHYKVVGQPGRQPAGFLVPGFIKAAVERVTG
ncbi:hypothetical protein HOU96_gp09 [Arthrobacter phage Maja]|uniref:Uncharacterized protein n=1 Tax=Arthrobacter phage Maja TaxID=2499009 RepID=A0A3S9UN27_9CAUD|nr:hypothetical protein HOU96_gp09 [Arthrobacter phage Maja]AZS11707.1 hypothetical protein PBI_MAJA_9 [Arthrobacter phage Maja]